MLNRKNVRLLVAASALAAVSAAPAVAGTVTGTIKFDGTAPKLRPVQMNADPGCAKKHSTPPANEALVLGDGNTLGNVFVKIKAGLPSKEWPKPGPVTLDQEGCRYDPHVMGVMVGQEVKILNSDGLLHNIHSLPKVNQSFNQAMPATVTELTKSFSKPEPMFKIKCDVHPWMGAWVEVLDHPFFDTTGEDGKFEIKGLPPGTYEIEAWHEKLRTKTAKVTISGDESKSVDFAFAVPGR